MIGPPRNTHRRHFGHLRLRQRADTTAGYVCRLVAIASAAMLLLTRAPVLAVLAAVAALGLLAG